MFDMFGAELPTPMPQLELQPTTALPQRELLRREKELLGVYVSEHPFQAAAQALSSSIDMLIGEVSPETASGKEIRLAGMVTGIRTLLTRDGKGFCAATVEDLSGQIEVTVWPDLFEPTRELWADGKIVRFTARLSQRDERINITVRNVTEYDPHVSAEDAAAARQIAREAEAHAPPPKSEPAWKSRQNGNGKSGAAAVPPRPLRYLLRIEIAERPDAEADDRRRLATLIGHLRDAPGEDRVRLVLKTPARAYELDLPPCHLSPELEATLKPLLDADSWGTLHPEALPESVAPLAAEVA